VALIDEIPERSSIALDTDAIIYYVEEHDRFLPVIEPLIDAVAAGIYRLHVSVVSLLEVLVHPLREHRLDLAEQYREILGRSPMVALHAIDTHIAQRAALLRAQFRLRTPDAIIAATALVTGCSHLITNNASDFRRVVDLEVLAINDFA
jgi:predicted nucleic acid-binding protein